MVKKVIKDGIAYSIYNTYACIASYTENLPEHVIIPDKIEGIPVKYIHMYAFLNSEVVSVIIPNSVVTVSESAFSECSSLISVTIPDSVVEIGPYAFENCTSLMNIKLSNSIKLIDEGVFLNCQSLKNIKIPDSVTGIDDNAFNGCESLESVTIPGSVTYISEGAFWNCYTLKTFYLSKLQGRMDNILFYGADTAPEIFFKGTKKGFEHVFIYNIYRSPIAENKEGYFTPVTVHCTDGDLIC